MKNCLMGFMMVLLSCLLISCGDSDSTRVVNVTNNTNNLCGAGNMSGPNTLSTIVISGSPQNIHTGTAVQYTADGLCSDGSVLDLTRLVTWTSSNMAIATVSTAGVVQGLQIGSSSIAAQIAGLEVNQNVSVTAANLLSIQISPHNFGTYVGLITQCNAIGTYDDGTSQDISLSSTWSSATATIASVNTTGLATAVSAGSSLISATLAGISGASLLTVNTATLQSIVVTPTSPVLMHVGITTQFSATGVYSDGGTADLSAQSTWSADSNALTINAATGQAVGANTGIATVTASFDQQSGSTTAKVNNAVLETLVISPAASSALMGTNIQYTAQAGFSDGSSTDVTDSALWSVSTVPANAQPATATDGSVSINIHGLLHAAVNTTLTAVEVNATFNVLSSSTPLQILSPTGKGWLWIGGTQTANDPGRQNADILLPSSRALAATAVDGNHQFWLFGGQDWTKTTSPELWVYTNANNSWAQKTSLPTSSTAAPQTADAAAVFIGPDSIYVFGGDSVDPVNHTFTISGALWLYSIQNDSWTSLDAFSSSQSNTNPAPAPRYGHRIVASTDSNGNPIFYLFGGQSFNGGPTYFNDLWKFDPPTNGNPGGWTLLLPNSTTPSYGIPGLSAPTNQIPARSDPNMWMANGKIWIFGGNTGLPNFSNDLWSIDPADPGTGLRSTQTWVTGEANVSGLAPYATYGSFGVPSKENTPGGRSQSGGSWVDINGNLWLTSGYGLGIFSGAGTVGSSYGTMNDVWQFNTQSLEWTWMGGPNFPGQQSIYPAAPGGTIIDPAISPSGRLGAAGWYDPTSDKFYLFGGVDASNFYNDLWSYGHP